MDKYQTKPAPMYDSLLWRAVVRDVADHLADLDLDACDPAWCEQIMRRATMYHRANRGIIASALEPIRRFVAAHILMHKTQFSEKYYDAAIGVMAGRE